MRDHLIVFAVTALATLVTTPVVAMFARRHNLVVIPDERRTHDRPTPSIGGLAMFAGVAAGLAVASQLDTYRAVFDSNSEPYGVLVAAAVIVLVGFLDDVREVSAPAKMAGQVLAGSILALGGVTMVFFKLPFGDVVVLGADLAPLVTVVWVLVFANAINFIDGLDGLAAGIVAIGGAAFFLYSDLLRDGGQLGPSNAGAVLAIIAIGACVGFLPWNFYPARIFMGDSGAMLLGLLMAASAMVVVGRANDQFAFEEPGLAPVVIPFIVLGVAVLDVLLAVARRLGRRKSFATRDLNHLHHQLLRLGHTQRRSVLILWSWTLLLSGLALYPSYSQERGAMVPFALVAVALVVFTVVAPRFGSRRAPEGARDASPRS